MSARVSPSRAVAARLAAGYTRKAAAKLLCRSERYLGQLERAGVTWPYHLAQRAAALYQCRIEVFLANQGDRARQGA
jgi:hypothetical protein